MKTKFYLSLIISIFIGLFIFSGNATAATPEFSKKNGTAQTQKDGEIVALLIVLNKNEIAAAKEALKKVKNPTIKQYAKMLKKEHTKNLSEALTLSKKMDIAPVETVTVMVLKQDGKKEMITLAALHAKDFETKYIDAMIKDHTDALKMIDNNLLKNATNPYLKAQIEATRPHIVSHLQQAQAIQNKLKTVSLN